MYCEQSTGPLGRVASMINPWDTSPATVCFFFCWFSSVWDRVLLCSSCEYRTHYEGQAGLDLMRCTCFCPPSAGIKGILSLPPARFETLPCLCKSVPCVSVVSALREILASCSLHPLASWRWRWGSTTFEATVTMLQVQYQPEQLLSWLSFKWR